ncbi:MAG: class I SAM-dependent DNA methyltransferase [Deltaproteobacteria bacterium]|jgi:hypothetical protein|nr:class I SAM-dependent DNA methyltransferase [Deltaproteobacteria bacterium]
MTIRWDEIQGNAFAFSKRWKSFSGLEKQHDQQFVTELLACFGVNASEVGSFQEKAGTKWVDYLWPGMLGIEMKSPNEDLKKAKNQLFDYLPELPPEAMPKFLIVSDFLNIHLYKLSTNEIHAFKTAELRKHIKRFADIAGYLSERTFNEQVDVNVKAAEKMARLHDAMKSIGYEGRDLEIYLTRLLFCLFAEDTGIFPKDAFLNYIEDSHSSGQDLSDRLARLFEVLNMPDHVRKKKTLLSDELKSFRYINGKLFIKPLLLADFDAKMRQNLLECCDFNWDKISPAIFGAMFQGVMTAKERRTLGAHYTSEENILKLINPLFLDDLWREFDHVKTDAGALSRFHDKISSLKFLDPACGCGNFLIITYRELRLLEIKILKMLYFNRQRSFINFTNMLKVSVEQFYGIELEEFPGQIAQTGMWLMDHQMNILVSEEFGVRFVRLPLDQSATIVRGNSLRLDWLGVCSPDYILGNPPFSGARTMTATQKEDMAQVYGNLKGVGNLDYVTAWFKKAADLAIGTEIKCAFVATSSVAQGEQPVLLWKDLMKRGAFINFRENSFKWSNEGRGQAAVYVVIIGFSGRKTNQIFNQYLLDAPAVFIESRQKPICDVPEIGIGNKPIDGGNYLFTTEEKDEFIRQEPEAEKWFKPWMGADEFLNGYTRYCLWLGDCPPNELRKMPEVLKRVSNVRSLRIASQSLPTRKLAEFPTRFHVENTPDSDYIFIPRVSSEKRRYIPIGFLSSNIITSDSALIIPNATLYHFAVLTSIVHMAWVRVVCGRLENRYRYSKDIVYNNFPWPKYVTTEQMAKIGQLAQVTLDARKLFPNSSLADLYDPLTMPQELLKAHRAIDQAVLRLYGVFAKGNIDETVIAAKLMELFQKYTSA